MVSLFKLIFLHFEKKNFYPFCVQLHIVKKLSHFSFTCRFLKGSFWFDNLAFSCPAAEKLLSIQSFGFYFKLRIFLSMFLSFTAGTYVASMCILSCIHVGSWCKALCAYFHCCQVFFCFYLPFCFAMHMYRTHRIQGW